MKADNDAPSHFPLSTLGTENDTNRYKTGLYSINAVPQEENMNGYFNQDDSTILERLKYTFTSPFMENNTKIQKVSVKIYNDQRSTYIGKDYSSIEFDLKMLFKVKASTITFFNLIDFFSQIGGSFSTYTVIFITIPAILFIQKDFVEKIVRHIT